MSLMDALERELELQGQVARGEITPTKMEREVRKAMTQWTEISGGPGSYWDKEEPIEGVLVEVLEHQGQYDKPVYVIKTGDGNVGVNASTVIESKMSRVPLGYMVRITALGEAKSEKTGRTYQDFKVEVGGMAMEEVAATPKAKAKPMSAPAMVSADDEDIPFVYLAPRTVSRCGHGLF